MRFTATDPVPLLAARIAQAGGNYVKAYPGSDAKELDALIEELRPDKKPFLLLELEEFAVEGMSPDTDEAQRSFEIELTLDPATPAACRAAEAIRHALATAELEDFSFEARIVKNGETRRKSPGNQRAAMRVGLPALYRGTDPAGSEVTYPELLNHLAALVYDVLLRGIHAFVQAAGGTPRQHHRAYGRRTLVAAAGRIDREIAKICAMFDFLLEVTPINSESARIEFEGSDYDSEPEFRYRPLRLSIDDAKRHLHAIDIDVIEDPVLIELFEEKRRELDYQLSMLQLRDTEKFLAASTLVYGTVSDEEVDDARVVLAAADEAARHATHRERCCDCYEVQRRAEALIGTYREKVPGFGAATTIRDDVPAGLLVSGPRLLISRHSLVPVNRLEALLAHEVGVHLVTYFAGAAQPLTLFRSGLAGYEGLQEGLGVFAEFAVGGLTPTRVRLLAARVLACRAVLDGATFVDTYRMLSRDLGFGKKSAFSIAMRVHRSGGLVKDAIYLRGLRAVLEILATTGSLELLWIGKIAQTHLRAVHELLSRNLLNMDGVKPHFLGDDDAVKRLRVASGGVSVADLLHLQGL